MGRPVFRAFIDEAGQRSRTTKSSDHFVMAAVLVPEEALPQASTLLASMRTDLGRQPQDTLHWRNIKAHTDKVHFAQGIGSSAAFLRVSAVVVCKRHLPDTGMNDDQAYLFTLRFLLERLSWMARDNGRMLTYTLAHIVRFKKETLREYERILRAMSSSDCKIDWASLDPRGGQIDTPNSLEYLQLSDAAASATFAAFEPDRHGNTENRYLRELAPSLYRRGATPTALTSYGLKMHPWTDVLKAAHPWIASL